MNTRHESEQQVAIKWGKELGQKIAAEQPDFVDSIRDIAHFRTFEQIGFELLDKMGIRNVTSPLIVRKAVAHAVEIILGQEKAAEITRLRHGKSQTFQSDDFRDKAKNNWRKRQEIHGAPVKALIEGRGQTPWMEEEQELFLELKREQDVDYETIAKKLNEKFHEGKNIRSAKSVGNWYRDMRRKARLNSENTFLQRFL